METKSTAVVHLRQVYSLKMGKMSERLNVSIVDNIITQHRANLTTTTTSNDSSKVFLQTATTYAAYSQHSNRAIPVRVLLDRGSQRSYATNHLKKRIGEL